MDSKTFVFVACVVAILATADAQPGFKIQERIVGGYGVPTSKFIYQAGIREVRDKGFRCSGAILSERWVVTAARCVVDFEINDLEIIYGSRTRNDGRVAKVSDIFVHKKYNRNTFANDIAMLSTAARMKLSVNVAGPIALPTEAAVAEQIALVSGWGVTHADNGPMSEILRFQTTKVISLNICKRSHDPTLIHDTSLCTENSKGVGNCVGDRGNPLVSKYQQKALIGVASWYTECADGKPDVYTAVYPYLEWIKEKLAQHE